jgi:hypothetical protein
VDRGRRLQKEAFTGRETAAPHQASEPGQRPVSDSAMLTHEPGAWTLYVQSTYVHSASSKTSMLLKAHVKADAMAP